MKPTALFPPLLALTLSFVAARWIACEALSLTSPSQLLASAVPAQTASPKPEVALEIVPFDPKALRAILTNPDSYAQLRDLTAFTDHLRPEDFPGAIEVVQKMLRNERGTAISLLAGRWIQVDPKNALKMANEPGHSDLSNTIIQAFYADWVARDPAEALASARKLKQGSDRNAALNEIADYLAINDPAQAMALFRSIRSSAYSDRFQNVFSHWVDLDLDGATDAVLHGSNFASERGRGEAIEGIVNRLVARDPNSAGAWLEGLPAGSVRERALEQVIKRWGEADPGGAMAWLEKLPDSPGKKTALRKLSDGWAKADPPGAMAYAQTLSQGMDQDNVVNQSLDVWTRANAPAAWEWVKNLPPSPFREKSLGTVIANWATIDPAAASRYLSSLSDGDSHINQSETWNHPSPKTEAYEKVAREWGRADPTAAMAWLTQMPSGAMRDVAIVGFSGTVISTNPAQALQMAGTISNAQNRQGQINSLYGMWLAKDPAAATAAIKASSRPEESKQQLLHPMTLRL